MAGKWTKQLGRSTVEIKDGVMSQYETLTVLSPRGRVLRKVAEGPELKAMRARLNAYIMVQAAMSKAVG